MLWLGSILKNCRFIEKIQTFTNPEMSKRDHIKIGFSDCRNNYYTLHFHVVQISDFFCKYQASKFFEDSIIISKVISADVFRHLIGGKFYNLSMLDQWILI
jgi:hypothetical protein